MFEPGKVLLGGCFFAHELLTSLPKRRRRGLIGIVSPYYYVDT